MRRMSRGVLQRAVVPPGREIEVWRTVGEHGAQPRLLQRGDRGVGVLGRVLDVRPVEERGDAGVDGAVGAHEVAGIGVLRPVDRCEHAEDVAEVVVEQRVGGDVAEDAFPDVAVRVDEPRHHDGVGGVDHVGVADRDVGRDGLDLRAFDQDVGLAVIAERRIQRQHAAVAKQGSLGHVAPLWTRGPSRTRLGLWLRDGLRGPSQARAQTAHARGLDASLASALARGAPHARDVGATAAHDRQVVGSQPAREARPGQRAALCQRHPRRSTTRATPAP